MAPFPADLSTKNLQYYAVFFQQPLPQLLPKVFRHLKQMLHWLQYQGDVFLELMGVVPTPILLWKHPAGMRAVLVKQKQVSGLVTSGLSDCNALELSNKDLAKVKSQVRVLQASPAIHLSPWSSNSLAHRFLVAALPSGNPMQAIAKETCPSEKWGPNLPLNLSHSMLVKGTLTLKLESRAKSLSDWSFRWPDTLHGLLPLSSSGWLLRLSSSPKRSTSLTPAMMPTPT